MRGRWARCQSLLQDRTSQAVLTFSAGCHRLIPLKVPRDLLCPSAPWYTRVPYFPGEGVLAHGAGGCQSEQAGSWLIL